MPDPFRILIVDDHELASSGIALALSQRSQYSVVGILTRGKDVRAETERLQPDILLLDLNLPDVSGLDVLVEMSTYPGCRTIMLSGEDSAADFQFALEAGAAGLVSKSDPVAMIVAALDAVSTGGDFVSPTIQKLLSQDGSTPISLSPRQASILRYLAAGETNKEISYKLSISPPTVSFHLRELRRKLGVKGNKKILNRAAELGLLSR